MNLTDRTVHRIPSVFAGYGDALLFDSNKQPKPAYYSVAAALANATVTGVSLIPPCSSLLACDLIFYLDADIRPLVNEVIVRTLLMLWFRRCIEFLAKNQTSRLYRTFYIMRTSDEERPWATVMKRFND